MRLSNLGNSLLSRFEYIGSMDDIEESVAVHKEAAVLCLNRHADQCAILTNLAGSLTRRFDRSGNLSDIHEAIRLRKDALALVPDGNVIKSVILSDLGTSFARLFEHSGNLFDVDQAIMLQQQAIESIPAGHASIAKYLNTLGHSCLCRFQRLGSIYDLNRSIGLRRQAVSMTPEGHISRAMYLNNLANSLLRRFNHSADVFDIDEAIELHRQTVHLTSDDYAVKHRRLDNLEASLFCRFERLQNRVDIDEAILLQLQAISLTPDDHADKPAILSNVGNSLLRRFESWENVTDLDEAIHYLQRAVELTPDQHANKAIYLNNLGNPFLLRFHHLHNRCDLEDATSTFRRGAECQSASPSTLLGCAKQWAWCFLQQEWTPSLEAHSTIVNLVSRIVWLGTNITQRYHNILTMGDAINVAASVAIELEQYEIALEWLEQGRSVVWGQILNLRTPLDELKLAGHGDLADELLFISQQLEVAGSDVSSVKDVDALTQMTSYPLEYEAQKHHRLAERYEELLDEVRNITGFERFLQPKQFSELVGCANTSPVVVINVNKTRRDALILRNNDSPVLHVSLPMNSRIGLDETLRIDLMVALADVGIRDRDGRATSPLSIINGLDKPLMQHVLEALWTGVVNPVLSALNYTVCKVCVRWSSLH